MHSLSASITCSGPIMRAKPLICRLDGDLNTALWRPGDCQTVTTPTLDVSRDFIWCLAKMPSPLMHSLSATITCTGPITGAKPLICRLDVDLAGVCLWVFFHGGNSCGVRYQSGLLFFFLLLLVFLFYFLFVFDLWMNLSSTSYFIDPQFVVVHLWEDHNAVQYHIMQAWVGSGWFFAGKVRTDATDLTEFFLSFQINEFIIII